MKKKPVQGNPYLWQMRAVVSSLLLLVMLSQVFSKTIIFTAFKINQDYIAKNLCENRALPEKHCCGKCQLKKRLEKDEQGADSRLPSSLKSFDELVLFSEENTGLSFSSYTNGEILFFHVAQKAHSALRDGVFHPPDFVC